MFCDRIQRQRHPRLQTMSVPAAYLQCKHVCMGYVKTVDINTMSWEGLAAVHTKCRSRLNQGGGRGEKLLTTLHKRERRQEHSNSIRHDTTHNYGFTQRLANTDNAIVAAISSSCSMSSIFWKRWDSLLYTASELY